MTGAIIRVSAWAFLGAAVDLGLFWALVNTPDSNLGMLALSLLVLLAMVAVTALALQAAVRSARYERVVGAGPRSWARAVVLLVLACLPALLIVWLASRVDSWVLTRGGEIDAWFIARVGWSDIGWGRRGLAWLLTWARWVMAPWVAVTLFAAALDRPPSDVLFGAWLRRAFSLRALVSATIAALILWYLPWTLTAWRPAVPPTWIEPFVVGVKLLLTGLLMAIGAGTIIVLAAGRPRVPQRGEVV